MRRFYSHLPYYLVIFFFYWPLYELFSLLSSGSNLLGLYLLNIFIFSPLVTFSISLIYGYRFPFSLRWLFDIGLLFCVTIIPFHDFSIVYFLAYEILALLGMSTGVFIKYLRDKRKNIQKSWFFNHTIIHRDKSLSPFLLDSTYCWKRIEWLDWYYSWVFMKT